MSSVYVSPEWLEDLHNSYKEDPTNFDFFKGRTAHGMILAYVVKADPQFALDSDIIFTNFFMGGELVETKFAPIDEAYQRLGGEEYKEYFLISSTSVDWKRVIQRKDKFITNLMTKAPGENYHKIECVVGDKVAIVSLAPYADRLVACLARVETIWPDEMSPTDLRKHVEYVKEFRATLGV